LSMQFKMVSNLDKVIIFKYGTKLYILERLYFAHVLGTNFLTENETINLIGEVNVTKLTYKLCCCVFVRMKRSRCE
jgi:hypothetical protein